MINPLGFVLLWFRRVVKVFVAPRFVFMFMLSHKVKSYQVFHIKSESASEAYTAHSDMKRFLEVLIVLKKNLRRTKEGPHGTKLDLHRTR